MLAYNSSLRCDRPRGSHQPIILILKQNLPRNSHFEALEPHFRVPNCSRKGPGIPAGGDRKYHLKPKAEKEAYWPSLGVVINQRQILDALLEEAFVYVQMHHRR
jgi:hypothetical protein